MENSGLKPKFLYYNCLRSWVVPNVQDNMPETSPFSFCPNGCAEQLPSSVYST